MNCLFISSAGSSNTCHPDRSDPHGARSGGTCFLFFANTHSLRAFSLPREKVRFLGFARNEQTVFQESNHR